MEVLRNRPIYYTVISWWVPGYFNLYVYWDKRRSQLAGKLEFR